MKLTYFDLFRTSSNGDVSSTDKRVLEDQDDDDDNLQSNSHSKRSRTELVAETGR